MKDLLRLLITIAVLAFVVRFALENVRPGQNYASGTGSATMNWLQDDDTRVVIRATAIGDAEPGGRISLDIRVNRKSCSSRSEAYRKPSTPQGLRAELRCPERKLKGGDEYIIIAEAVSEKAEDARVELVVEKVD